MLYYYYYYTITASQNAGDCKKKKECKVCKKMHLGYLRSYKPTRLKGQSENHEYNEMLLRNIEDELRRNNYVLKACDGKI